MKKVLAIAALFLLGIATPSALLAFPPDCAESCFWPGIRCCSLCSDNGWVTNCGVYLGGACVPCGARSVPESEKQLANAGPSLEEILAAPGAAAPVCGR